MEYYRFLATNAYVIGTDDPEFSILSKDEEGITVTASRRNPPDKNDVNYTRKFDKKNTKKIYILGLGGNDHFQIDENVDSSIKVRLEGGEGNDVYKLEGKIKSTIEDNDNNDTSVLAKSNKK